MKFFKHLKVVIKHKHFVFHYACKLGIPWTGFIHDISKFSPTEFHLSAKNFLGDESPTIEERRHYGDFSLICAHHTGRNKHHWQYWIDFTRTNIIICRIPYRNSLEYVADIIAASRVYHPKDFNLMVVYNYFSKQMEHYLIHPATKEFITWCVMEANNNGFKAVKKKLTRKKYDEISQKYELTVKLPLNSLPMNLLDIKK